MAVDWERRESGPPGADRTVLLGALTDRERQTLEACPHVSVVTIPGTSYFIPGEEPHQVAELVVEALGRS